MNKNNTDKSGLATAALVLGIIGVILSFVPIINNLAFVMGGLALIFAIVTLIKKKSIATSIVALVLAIASMGITLAMQKTVGDALDKAGEEISNSINDVTGENTDAILEHDVLVEFGAFEVTTDEYGIEDGKLSLAVTNKASGQHSYSIQIEALNADNARIAEDTVYVNNLGAGQTQNVEAFTLTTTDTYEALKVATFKVVSVSKS